MSGKHANRAKGDKRGAAEHVIDEPSTLDGAAIWRIARDSGKLDLNSSYAYLMWCHDFAGTSAVARVDNEVVGFVIGYRRPTRPDTVVVWQIAVADSQRGRGTARALLDALVGRLVEQGVHHMETTITPDNAASTALFASLAKHWGATMDRAGTFDSGEFPDDHESEIRFRIGPFRVAPGVRAAS